MEQKGYEKAESSNNNMAIHLCRYTIPPFLQPTSISSAYLHFFFFPRLFTLEVGCAYRGGRLAIFQKNKWRNKCNGTDGQSTTILCRHILRGNKKKHELIAAICLIQICLMIVESISTFGEGLLKNT